MMKRGDELVDRLCGGGDGDPNDLLAEIRRGYPISSLRPLLRSQRETAVKAAAWIVSELGKGAAPLLPDVAPLLRHPARVARFFGLEIVLVNASPVQGEIIMMALRLIDDPDAAVRAKALEFLPRWTRPQLQAALRHATDIKLARLIKWLLNAATPEHVDQILVMLEDADPTTRRFAAAAAARIAASTRLALERAARSEDEEIGSFAREILAKPI